jgi:cell division protease FtsH
LAKRLLEKEVIFKDDLEKIFGKRPFDKDLAEEANAAAAKIEDEKNKTEPTGEEADAAAANIEDEKNKTEPTAEEADAPADKIEDKRNETKPTKE